MVRPELSIKARLILLGIIVVIAFLIIIISSTIINQQVSKDVYNAERSSLKNNEYLTQIYTLDLIKISQSKLLRLEKDIIINKDEIMVAPSRIREIKKEGKQLG